MKVKCLRNLAIEILKALNNLNYVYINLANKQMLKVNNRSTRKRC